jgi:hypothetical protein
METATVQGSRVVRRELSSEPLVRTNHCGFVLIRSYLTTWHDVSDLAGARGSGLTIWHGVSDLAGARGSCGFVLTRLVPHENGAGPTGALSRQRPRRGVGDLARGCEKRGTGEERAWAT